MSALDEIRLSIEQQYRVNPDIHISVSVNRPRIKIDKAQAAITAVYPNFFQVEAQGKCYTHKYVDILMGNVSISEIAADFDKYNISSDGHTLNQSDFNSCRAWQHASTSQKLSLEYLSVC